MGIIKTLHGEISFYEILYICIIMNEKELNKDLRSMAIGCGICKQFLDEWGKDWTVDHMISQFFKGIDFYLKKRFVSNEYIKANFDRDFLRSKGALVDDKYSLLNPTQAILIGNSNGTLRINGYTVSTIYVIDDSHAKIIVKGNAFALVHALGNARIDASLQGNAKCTVLRHSETASVIASAGVKVTDELDYLKKI